MSERILVLGGTGLLGGAVARALVDGGWTVRIVTRQTGRTGEPNDQGVELVAGDVSDRESLRKAMAGCFGVHISVGGPVDLASAQNVCSLAPEAGIGYITYISGATVCEENRWFPMVAQKLEAERVIREAGFPNTIFRPTWPMEMLDRFARGGKPVMMGAQEYPIHWYAADDLGRMVAAAYQVPAARDKRLYIHGPEGIPMREALQAYCNRLFPGAAKVSVMSIGLAKLIAALTRNAQMKYGATLMGYFDKVGEMGDPSEANSLLGAPSVRLDEWLSARAKTAAPEGRV